MRGRSVGALATLLFLLFNAPDGWSSHHLNVEMPVRQSILVEGDQDFVPSNGVRGGSGTAEDPFVISNWTIVKDHSYGVRIAGTSAHVVLENIFMEGLESSAAAFRECLGSFLEECPFVRGIDLAGASNVSMRNITVLHGGVGIQIHDSFNVEVTGAAIGLPGAGRASHGAGLDVLRSDHVVIRNSTITSVEWPFLLTGSKSFILEGSLLRGQRPPSLRSTTVPIGMVEQVYLSGNVFDQTEILLSGEITNLTLSRNTFERGNPTAVSVAGYQNFKGITVCGNVFEGIESAPLPAFTLVGSEILILGNTFLNSTGTSVAIGSLSTNVTLERNLFQNSTRFGASLRSRDAQIHWNSFVDNRDGLGLSLPANGTENWWGHASGPSGVGPGMGDSIVTIQEASGNVPYAPWLEAPPDLTVQCPPPPVP